MMKQRLFSFFLKEEAEAYAQKVNARVIPRLECINGDFLEWFDVWIEYEEEVE